MITKTKKNLSLMTRTFLHNLIYFVNQVNALKNI